MPRKAKPGELFYVSPSPDLRIPMCIAEVISDGSYKKCVIVYVFRPELNVAQIIDNSSRDMLLLDPLCMLPDYFHKQAFTSYGINAIARVPIFSRHIFKLNQKDGLRSSGGDVLDPEDVASDENLCTISLGTGILGLTQKISKALSLEIDYKSWADRLHNVAYPRRPVTEDKENSCKVDMLIYIPEEDQPDEVCDMWEFEDKLMELIEGGKLGEFVGAGTDLEDACRDFQFMIRRRKYPEAAHGVRELLEREGIVGFRIEGYRAD